MARLDDEAFVQEQYRSTERLETRISVWRPGPDGVSAQDVAVAALAEVHPARLLEVGCGTGAFAQRCAEELGCEVVALDASPEMVRTTAGRGIDARVGDVRELPFADGSFDCAVAAWMLYHVADIDRALAELARVLRPGGRLVAMTNGAGHTRELYEAVGADRGRRRSAPENGGERSPAASSASSATTSSRTPSLPTAPPRRPTSTRSAAASWRHGFQTARGR